MRHMWNRSFPFVSGSTIHRTVWICVYAWINLAKKILHLLVVTCALKHERPCLFSFLILREQQQVSAVVTPHELPPGLVLFSVLLKIHVASEANWMVIPTLADIDAIETGPLQTEE